MEAFGKWLEKESSRKSAIPDLSIEDVSMSPSNCQYSKKNISPSSSLILRTPCGFWSTSRLCMSKFLRTKDSSSGKYLIWEGRLYGHCASTAAACAGELEMSMRREAGKGRRAFRERIGVYCSSLIRQERGSFFSLQV